MLSLEDLEKQLVSSGGSSNSSPNISTNIPQPSVPSQGNLANPSNNGEPPNTNLKTFATSNILNLLGSSTQNEQSWKKSTSNLPQLTVPGKDSIQTRRDTPHPSEGVSDAVFNPVTHHTTNYSQVGKGSSFGNVSPLRNLASSPTGSRAPHHISHAKSPAKASISQISPKDWEIKVKTPSEATPLQMNVIANYNFDPRFQFGKTIATNGTLAVYGLQRGFLRVLNCINGASNLLIRHTNIITDLAFMKDTDNFASSSFDSQLIIWKLDKDELLQLEKTKGEGIVTLIVKQPSNSVGLYFKRILWNPNGNGTLIALRNDNLLVSFNIQELVSQLNDKKEIEFSFNNPGIFLISAPSEIEINDLCFSKDGEYLVVGDNSGTVKVFSSGIYQQKSIFSSFNGPIYSVNFCFSNSQNVSDYLIVGGERNIEFKLWNLEDLTVPHLVQTVKLIGPENSILYHVHLDSSSQYLIAANMNQNTLLLLHLVESEEGNMEFKDISQFQSKDKIINFTTETKHASDVTFIGVFCITANDVGLISISGTDASKIAERGTPLFPTINEVPEIQIPTFNEIKKPHPARASPTKPEDLYFPLSPRSPSQSPISQRDSDTFSVEFQRLESSLLSKFNTMLHQERQTLKLELDAERQLMILEEQKRQQELIKVISSLLANEIPQDISKKVEQSINSTVIPSINKQIETLSKNLSKRTEDSIKKQMKDTLKETFKAGLLEVLLPSFQKMFGGMLEQLTKVFEKGIEEQLKLPLEKYYKEVNDNAIAKLQSEAKKIFKNSGKTPEKATKVESVYDEILSLFAKKEYNQAFSKVLSVLDVDFVVWACKNVNVDDIFGQDPVPLNQAVILSLLHQLSSDFSKDAELKLDWIQKSAVVLHPNDPVIVQSANTVLSHIQQQLDKGQKQNPHLGIKFKMASQMIRAIGH